MNVREAILKAADHIEANPDSYDFWAEQVPYPNGGYKACMWGWVGWFMEMHGDYNLQVAIKCGVHDTLRLYDMGTNKTNPNNAAKALRSFADKYHPEQYPEIRDELTRIFNEEPAWTAS